MNNTRKHTIGCIVGTRPELIKMAPIIQLLRTSSLFNVIFINTAQHRELLDELFDVFNLFPDIDLNIMTSGQTLSELSSRLITKLDALVKEHYLDWLVAAGDTTTVFVASLIAFYNNIPFAHIEAGLRTTSSREPFPEEMNRRLCAQLATLHFAPTHLERENLIRENINPKQINVSGNPVIDALQWVLKEKKHESILNKLDNIVLVTVHRRENFGKPLKNICQALLELAKKFKKINFVFPVHPNPNVQKVVRNILENKPGINLVEPLKYDTLAQLLKQCKFVMTDSGGIQEEAPALGKPVLVLRNCTERHAILIEKVGKLIGTDKETIVHEVSLLIEGDDSYFDLSKIKSPYGDGHAAKRIVDCLKKHLY